MPKEGFESITVPEALNKRVSEFVENSSGIVGNKAQAFSQAWQFYERMMLETKNPLPVKIGNKLVGHDQPVFVTGELGINHNGDIAIAKKLIDMAADTGCDAVKFQKRTVEDYYDKEELAMARDSPFGKTNETLKRGLEFDEDGWKELIDHAEKRGLIWYASVWDHKALEFVEKFDPVCHKIASPQITHKTLLKKVKETGKPIILSTGMSTMDQVRKAVNLLGEENLIILHCTSTYPTAENEHNLNMMKTLRKYFNCPIGYSGHEPGVYPSLFACVLGACMVERHITLDRAMYGSDQPASLERRGMEIICNVSRKIRSYMGDGNKVIYESEKPIIKKLRKVDDL